MTWPIVFSSLIGCSFILEEAVKPESAKDSLRYRARPCAALRGQDRHYDFLRTKKPDNAICKANWRNDPWFPDVLEEERKLDLQL
jgi:hypothetical protein